MKAKSSPSLRLPLVLAFFGFVLIGMMGGANGVLLPSLGAFYSIGDAVIGLLFLVSSLDYLLSALSSGLLTVGFCFIGFSLGPIYPLTVAITPKLVPAGLGPSAIGVLVSVSIMLRPQIMTLLPGRAKRSQPRV